MNFIKKFNSFYRLGRYDKPIGYMYLFWPCTWGVAAAALKYSQIFFYVPIFFCGSVALRAAGCIINDIFDKNFDSKVERTKSRPIAIGQLTIKQGMLFLIPNLTIGLLVLNKLNIYSAYLSFGIIPLVCLYPLAKRYFPWPQFILGLVFNWGVIVGYITINSSLNPVILTLYMNGILWTLIYDTIYAFQDIEDDKKLGIYSTAIRWEGKQKLIFNRLIMGSFLISISNVYFLPLNISVYIIGCIVIHLWLMYNVHKLSQSYFFKFKRNHLFGLGMFLVLVLSKIQYLK